MMLRISQERVEYFYRCAERIAGQVEALSEGSREHAVVDLMLSEALTTSAIEGENLDRDSVRFFPAESDGP